MSPRLSLYPEKQFPPNQLQLQSSASSQFDLCVLCVNAFTQANSFTTFATFATFALGQFFPQPAGRNL